MVQTRSSFKKNTTDANIEVNRDVAEASNMNQNKGKTTTAQVGKFKKSKSSENSKFVLIRTPITEEDLARDAFMVEYMRNYFEKHPDVTRLPEEEIRAGNKKFYQLVKTTKSKIVEEYFDKYIAQNGMDMTTKRLLDKRKQAE